MVKSSEVLKKLMAGGHKPGVKPPGKIVSRPLKPCMSVELDLVRNRKERKDDRTKFLKKQHGKHYLWWIAEEPKITSNVKPVEHPAFAYWLTQNGNEEKKFVRANMQDLVAMPIEKEERTQITALVEKRVKQMEKAEQEGHDLLPMCYYCKMPTILESAVNDEDTTRERPLVDPRYVERLATARFKSRSGSRDGDKNKPTTTKNKQKKKKTAAVEEEEEEEDDDEFADFPPKQPLATPAATRFKNKAVPSKALPSKLEPLVQLASPTIRLNDLRLASAKRLQLPSVWDMQKLCHAVLDAADDEFEAEGYGKADDLRVVRKGKRIKLADRFSWTKNLHDPIQLVVHHEQPNVPIPQTPRSPVQTDDGAPDEDMLDEHDHILENGAGDVQDEHDVVQDERGDVQDEHDVVEMQLDQVGIFSPASSQTNTSAKQTTASKKKASKSRKKKTPEKPKEKKTPEKPKEKKTPEKPKEKKAPEKPKEKKALEKKKAPEKKKEAPEPESVPEPEPSSFQMDRPARPLPVLFEDEIEEAPAKRKRLSPLGDSLTRRMKAQTGYGVVLVDLRTRDILWEHSAERFDLIAIQKALQ